MTVGAQLKMVETMVVITVDVVKAGTDEGVVDDSTPWLELEAEVVEEATGVMDEVD